MPTSHRALGRLVLGTGLLLVLTAACSSDSTSGPTTTTGPAASRPTATPTATPAASRPTVAAATACATDHPDRWMGCIRAATPGFASRMLTATALPGAHDAGTSALDLGAFDTQDGSDCTNYSPAFASAPSLVQRWSQTQTLDLAGQLDAGVRYLDLRIAWTGSTATGWRLVHTLFSTHPLATDLAQVAAWARAHPTEVVLADVQHLCYDNHPTQADERALWADFAPLAPVSYDPLRGRPVSTATLGGITGQGGRNVVVLLPSSVRQPSVLTGKIGVHATFTTDPGTSSGPHPVPSVPERYAWASTVAPSSAAGFDAANRALAAYPTTLHPPLGAMAGTGLFQAQLIYSLSSSDLSAELDIFRSFAGLIPPGPGAPPATQPAWEAGLWETAFGRNQVVAGWGHKLNVVVTDAVQTAGFVPAVVAQNGA